MYLVNWFDYWVFFAAIYLLILAYMDVKNKMLLDARWNYVMVGLSVSLLSHVHIRFWALLSLIAATFLLTYVINRVKLFGRSDVVAFSWIFWGFGIIYIPALIIFFLVTLILGFAMKLLAKRFGQDKFAFMPVIAASFIITVALLSSVLL